MSFGHGREGPSPERAQRAVFCQAGHPQTATAVYGGRAELETQLGGDRRQALAKLPAAVAALQHRIDLAEEQARSAGIRAITGRYPLSADQLAVRHYHDLLAFDVEIRLNDHRYAQLEIDDMLAADLRAGMAGKLSNEALDELVGSQIERFRFRGNTEVARGSPEWRELAVKLCVAEYEALSRAAERHEGDFAGRPQHPLIADAVPIEDEAPSNSVTFDSIIDAEVARRARGRGARPLPDRTVRKYRAACADFTEFRSSSNAAAVTALEGKRWIEAMQDGDVIGNRTVTQRFQNARTVLNWGRQADPSEFHPAGNPLVGIRTPSCSNTPSYLRAFTMDEASLVLSAARKEPKPYLRWVPWLCAYSGMRVSEAGALRKEDFFKVAGGGSGK